MPDPLNIAPKIAQTNPPQASGTVSHTEFNSIVTEVNNSINVSVDQTDVLSSAQQLRGRLNLGIFDIPSFRSFFIQGESTDLHAGDSVSAGQKTFVLDVIHPESFGTNRLTLTQGGTEIATDIDPNSSAFSATISAFTLTNVGDTEVFRISGTDASGAVRSRDLIFRAVAQSEFFYHGLSSSNNPASVPISGAGALQRVVASTGNHDFSVGPTSAGQYIILLAPSDHDLTHLLNIGFPTHPNVLGNFTRTENVRQINSVQYHSYVFGPTTAGATQTYRGVLA